MPTLDGVDALVWLAVLALAFYIGTHEPREERREEPASPVARMMEARAKRGE